VADAVHAALAAGAALDEVVVAVVSGRSAPGLAVLRALSEADIPAVDLRRSGGLASKLLALLDFATEVASNGLAREDVALLLRSRYLDAPTVAGDAAATAATLAVVASALEETATVDADDAAARLVATVAVALPPGDGDAREGLLRVASRTGLALARVARGNTRRDHTASLRALVADLGIDVAIRGQRARVGGLDGPLFADDLAARARDEAAWADFQRRLAAYERCCERLGIADAPTPLQTFRHELGWTATGASPAVSPSTSTVRVVDLADLRQEPLALVVLADADEEGWPDGARRSALVPRALGARLADALDPAARPIVEAGAAAVLARVALGVAGARRVVLSWAVLGEDGESRRAAPLLALLARGASGRVWTSGPDVQRPLSAQEERLVTLARDPAAAARIAPDVVRRLQLDARRTLAFGRTPSDGDPVAQSLPLGAPFAPILTAESGGGDRPVSASAVDALASCVFKGYATLVLRTRRPRAANDLADDREAGEVIHDGLEAAFRATSHLWRARPRDAETLLREGLAAADAAFAAGAVASRLARVTRDQARAGVRAVLAWSIADEAWDFALAEQAFGEPGAWDAVVLDWRGIRVAVRGRIDRVDVSHAGELAPRARVIDYKPKATSAERHTRSFGVTKLQLALYGRATEAAIGRPVEVGLYLPAQRLRPGATFAKGVDAWRAAHESEDGAPRYFEPIHASLTALRRGNVGPVPVDAEACTHCDFAGLCRKPRYAPGTPLGDEDGDEGDG
jgi:RecB family exonuclease